MIRGLALGFVSALALASAANAADLSGGYKDAPQAAWVSSDILSANNQVGIGFRNDPLRLSGNLGGAKLDSEGGWVPGRQRIALGDEQLARLITFYFRADLHAPWTARRIYVAALGAPMVPARPTAR